MKKNTTLLILLICFFLAACQAASPTALPQPTNPTLSQASPIPTSTTSSTATLLPTALPAITSTSIPAVTIHAFCTLIGQPAQTTVAIGTAILINWGWEAKTEALVQDFLDNSITTVTLDGKVLEGVSSGEMAKNEKSGQPEMVWFADVGVLEPGEHVVTYNVKFNKMVDDGTTTYGPGGKVGNSHDECQIVVK